MLLKAIPLCRVSGSFTLIGGVGLYAGTSPPLPHLYLILRVQLIKAALPYESIMVSKQNKTSFLYLILHIQFIYIHIDQMGWLNELSVRLLFFLLFFL